MQRPNQRDGADQIASGGRREAWEPPHVVSAAIRNTEKPPTDEIIGFNVANTTGPGS